MRISFVVAGRMVVGGGLRVIFEYANRLTLKGHQVTILWPQRNEEPDGLAGFADRLRALIYLQRPPEGPRWFDLKARLKPIPNPSERFVPKGDIIVATRWDTAEWVNGYSDAKGIKCYLIQSYEVWDGPKDRVEATYRMPLNKIAVSSWLKTLVESISGQEVYGPVVNGVDFDMFYNPEKVYHNPRRIGMVYDPTIRKGTADGLFAFELVRRQFPEVEFVMFGKDFRGVDVPEYVEYHHDPPQDMLREIYSSCDIWVMPSWLEGLGLVAMEAMACKCAVICADIPPVRDIGVPGETMLVYPPRNPLALADAIIDLIRNEDKLRRLSTAGYRYIRRFTWDRAVDQLEKIFLDLIEQSYP